MLSNRASVSLLVQRAMLLMGSCDRDRLSESFAAIASEPTFFGIIKGAARSPICSSTGANFSNNISMTEEVNSQPVPPTPLKNLIGAAISALLASGLYLLTNSVAHKLALSPFRDAESLAAKIGAVVRTFLLAVGTGATMIFAVVAVGLVFLTIQQVWQPLFNRQSEN